LRVRTLRGRTFFSLNHISGHKCWAVYSFSPAAAGASGPVLTATGITMPNLLDIVPITFSQHIDNKCEDGANSQP
jgi:hypothetical protein